MKPTLDQFLEPDDYSDEDFLANLRRYVNLGIDRKINLLSKIFARCDEIDGCLIWTGPTSGNGRGKGYGRFSHEGRTASVHRTVYSICYGPIPPKKQIDHKCNNRACCNPEHLFRVTHKRNQNLRDIRSRGKQDDYI